MIGIGTALEDHRLFGPSFAGDSWNGWRAVLRAAFAEQLRPEEKQFVDSVAGNRPLPLHRVRELWITAGRRSGKSRMAAVIGAYIATCISHADKLSPGETGYVLILSQTMLQATVVFGYVRALIEGSPVLRALIDTIDQNEIRLRGNITIAVHAASFRSVRGRTVLACVFDESAYWRDELSANPDVEVYRAILPALSTTNGMLIGIGSPYRRAGLMYTRYRDHYGKDSAKVFVVKAPTTTLNPVIDTDIITQAETDDPAAARSEWQAEFRTDLASFLDDDSIDAAINYSRPLELPPQLGTRYYAFTDASAGRHDNFTLCIGHRSGPKETDKIITDVLRGFRPPFDPAGVAREFAEAARQYHCQSITGDNYAGEWVSQAFHHANVCYDQAESIKSKLYLEGLPIFTRGLIEIPNLQILLRELRLLERRVARTGVDSVDHGVSGSDDYANALFGMISLAVAKKEQ